MTIARLAAIIVVTASLCGCTTWRCRGFIDVRDMPKETSSGGYRLESIDGYPGIEFRNIATLDQKDAFPHFDWLSQQDELIGTSFLADIVAEAGLTNSTSDAVGIRVSIVPISDERRGKKSFFWPMFCTLGVFPAHIVEELSFDVIVQFISKNPHHVYATASVGQIRTDYQIGLSRMDMDAPPDGESAMGELRDDGTIGTGRGLRERRYRDIFVKTVAGAIRRAIAEREKSVCEQIAQPATEYGAVAFPRPIVEEREKTSGWGNTPFHVDKPPETLSDFLVEAWNKPKTEQTKQLKRLVELGMITKDDWRRRLTEIWNSRKVQQ